MLDTGDAVPADLPLALSSGDTTTLADYRDQWLGLYFYPKDHTPGCTTESRDFTALLPKFEAAGARILPPPVPSIMSAASRVMKAIAYRI